MNPSQFGGTVGNTYKDNDRFAFSFGTGSVIIWNGAISLAIGGQSADYSGLQEAPVIGEVSAHELAHTFDVNQPADTTGWHCNNTLQNVGPYASNLTGHCLMNRARTNSERADGYFGFHNNPWDTSEYRRIRARPDPVPQEWQSTFNPNP